MIMYTLSSDHLNYTGHICGTGYSFMYFMNDKTYFGKNGYIATVIFDFGGHIGFWQPYWILSAILVFILYGK